MTDEKDTGGPAFPAPGDSNGFEGMDLLDAFAISALQGILAACNPGPVDKQFAAYLSVQSYDVAEAMIAERNKRGG